MSSVETGQMSAVETAQMSAAETGQMSAVETRQMSDKRSGPKSPKWPLENDRQESRIGPNKSHGRSGALETGPATPNPVKIRKKKRLIG